jgi:hypothetical protein
MIGRPVDGVGLAIHTTSVSVIGSRMNRPTALQARPTSDQPVDIDVSGEIAWPKIAVS